MTKSLSFLMVLLSSGIVIIIPLQIIAQTITIHPAPIPRQNSSNLINFELLATQITVKVIAGKTWGSGIIINREGSVYTVLTNRHVLTPSEHHQIK
ncbi:MAG: trypsin-like peptidase domain-containing protein, partial [Moorea sp. SIO3C2]|nr:trypsin-like peptidase domain-containing protein [Moorena sp. SIO3C2]